MSFLNEAKKFGTTPSSHNTYGSLSFNIVLFDVIVQFVSFSKNQVKIILFKNIDKQLNTINEKNLGSHQSKQQWSIDITFIHTVLQVQIQFKAFNDVIVIVYDKLFFKFEIRKLFYDDCNES